MSTRFPSLPGGSPSQQFVWFPALCLLALVPGAVSPSAPIGFALGWPALMLAPGMALYLLSARRERRTSELMLFGLVLSPVVTTVLGIAGLALKVPPVAITGSIAVLSVAAGVSALLTSREEKIARPDRRSLIWLSGLLAALVLLTAYLPMTRDWWRIRSDAWFHAAVVAQISDYGIPPQDPYFAGMPLQYMWFYHVLVLVLSRGLDIDPFRVMALINIQALLALGVAGWQLAGVFRRTFAHRLGAVAVLLLGFNGAFWVFLPIKLVKAMMGDVRGFDEIKRTYSLIPLDYARAQEFLGFYFNQEFFLDKYMVATAFGLSLAFMVAGWYGAAGYLRTRRPAPLVLLAGSLVGMLGFHSLVGFVTMVGIFGGAILAWLLRNRREPFPMRPVLVLLAVSLATFLATTPYLYAVMHLKEKEQVFPLSVSLPKTGGIFISCAFALALVIFRRPLFRDRSLHTRFFLLGALAVTVFCLIIRLPGPNTYDKLGYLVFLPMAVLAGIALADLWQERTGAARTRVMVLTMLCMLPVNAIAFTGCFLTADAVEVTPDEAKLSIWLRANTPRDALMVDDNDRVVFLVTVPRRYLWGCRAYAEQWGYPKLEMSRRFHMRRALYSPGELDASALDVLGGVSEPLYAIVRPEHRSAHAAIVAHPALFQTVYEADGYAVVRVDTRACRALAGSRNDHISPEELIRESGF